MVTANSTSLIPGKVHRRMFGAAINMANSQYAPVFGATTGSVTETTSAQFSFGLDNLPRRQNYVWAAEVVKINYYLTDYTDYTAAGNDWGACVAVCTSNSSELKQYFLANPGMARAVLRDEVLDACNYGITVLGSWTSSLTSNSVAYHPVGEQSHDLTDTMGQGVLVFGNNLYLIAHRETSSTTGLVQAGVEVWFRYREVPLEYYLSTQQDAAASGI